MPVKLPPAGGGKTATRAPRPAPTPAPARRDGDDASPMAKSRRRRFHTPGLPGQAAAVSVPGLDLKKVPRAKRMTALIPRHGRASQDVLNITNPKQGAAMERTTSQEQRKRAAS